MALPASGTLTIAQIESEFGLPAGSLFPNAFYGLGGAPASGTLTIPNDFYGRSSFPAVPTYVGSSTYQSSSTTSSITWPAHATNDVGILVVHTNNQAMPSVPTGCTLMNFTSGVGTSGAVGASRAYIYWIRATSGSMPAISIPDSGNITGAQMAVFRGCRSSGDPYEANQVTRQPSATTAVSMVNSTNLTGKNRLLVSTVIHPRDLNSSTNISGWANTQTAGMTEAFDNSTLTSNGGGLALAYGTINGQTDYGSTTATLAASLAHEGVSFALVPNGIPASGITPDAGNYTSYNSQDVNNTSFTLTASGPIVWTWTKTGAATGFIASTASGGTASSITFSLFSASGAKSANVQVTVGNYTWNISLSVDGSGGGCMTMAMTMTL